VVYEKGRPVRRANISKEAHQRDLYSFPEYGTGERNDSSERVLSQLETLVGALLPRVREITYIPTEEERSQLCWFVSLLFMRVPDAFRANRESVVPAVAQLFLKAAQDVDTFKVFYKEHCPAADTPGEIEDIAKTYLEDV